MSENSMSENSMSENSMSENSMSENSMSENSMSDDDSLARRIAEQDDGGARPSGAAGADTSDTYEEHDHE